MNNPIDPFHHKHLNKQLMNEMKFSEIDLHSGKSAVRQDEEFIESKDNRC
jgi:hypothetical protein